MIRGDLEMLRQIRQTYNKIKVLNIDQLLYVATFIILAGFLLNGCIFKICENISTGLDEVIDKLLFILEGGMIAIILMILFIRRPKRIIGIYSFLGVIFILSYFIFAQNKEAILTIVKDYFLYCVTSMILFWELSEDKNLYKNIVKISKITFIIAVLYLVLLLLNHESIYNLWLSRSLFFAGIFNLYDTFKNKSKSSTVISILSFITIFSTGSRTYLIFYSIFAILLMSVIIKKKINSLEKKKKIAIISLILIILAIICIMLINYKKICDNLFNFFLDKGIRVRVLRLLATGNFFTSNDRINIMYPTIVSLIAKNWSLGLGIGGDRTALYTLYKQTGMLKPDTGIEAYYSHNFFLELYSTFGVIIATALLMLMIYAGHRVIKNKKNIALMACFIFISILPLMLTGTFWDNVYFWALIGIICGNFYKKNEEPKETRVKMENIIMLLDNAFDPDVRVYKEAKYLVDNQRKVEIVCLDRKNKYIDKETEILEGIKIKRIFCRTKKTTDMLKKSKIISKIKGIIYFSWLLKFAFKVKKYLKNKDFEILHCHDLVMACIGVTFFRDKKIVFDMHEYYGNKMNKLKDYIIRHLVYYAQNRATWIIYVNNFQKQNCKQKNLDKLIEIPNYPDRTKFEHVKKTQSDKIRLAYIGKVRDYNSLAKFIDCYQDDGLLDIKIYGDGSQYHNLLEYATEHKKEFILQGAFNGVEDLQEIYNHTDILYSVYDVTTTSGNNWKNAMPVKSFEAILTLTPIIASKNTVLGNFVEEKDIGFTIDIHKEKDLQNLLMEIANHPDILDDKVKKLKEIQYLYIWENVVINLDKIYKR